MKHSYAFVLPVEVVSDKPFGEIPKSELIAAMRARLDQVEAAPEAHPFECFDTIPEGCGNYETATTEENIDDRVDDWHDGTHPELLHEHLGITKAQYEQWVETNKLHVA